MTESGQDQHTANESARHFTVVGGGMLGLGVALQLVNQGYQVTVLEAAPVLGGLASAWQVGDVVWDRYYHVIAPQDDHVFNLLEELGLSPQLQWGRTRTLFYDGKQHYPLNNAWDYARLPALGLIEKFRLAVTILYAARMKDSLPLESLKVDDWLTRWSGKRTFAQLWRPLLRAKLGDNYRFASAAYIWATIQRFYGARQGSRKTESFGYVKGGYRTILEAMAKHLEQRGVQLRIGAGVTAIEQLDDQRYRVQTGSETIMTDRVVMTCAAPLIQKLLPDLPAEENRRLGDIRYQGIVCASLVLKRPLGGAYLTYITDESLPFTTVIEMSSLVSPDNLGGHHLVYLPKYVPSDDDILTQSDEAIQASFIAGLKRMYPDLTDSDILACKIARTRYVLALTTLNYSAGLPPIVSGMPGCYLLNSAQIVNGSLSIDETLALAYKGADAIIVAERKPA